MIDAITIPISDRRKLANVASPSLRFPDHKAAVPISGDDSFSYVVSDGHGGFDTGVITVTVTGGNNAPVAANDNASASTSQIISIPVLANDTDVDGDTLTVTGVTTPNVGSASIAGGGTSISYTAPASTGTATFSYTVSDGNGGSDTATVTVAVIASNNAPNAVNDSASVTTANQVTISVLNNDTDPDGDALTITSVGTPSRGSATIVNGGTQIRFATLFTGTYPFSYTISDGNGGTDTATVTVTVTSGGGGGGWPFK